MQSSPKPQKESQTVPETKEVKKEADAEWYVGIASILDKKKEYAAEYQRKGNYKWQKEYSKRVGYKAQKEYYQRNKDRILAQKREYRARKRAEKEKDDIEKRRKKEAKAVNSED
jgi:hypothetical protein